MRILAFIVFTSTLASTAYAQQKGEFPKDGNGLLEYCSVVVDFMDSPTTLSSLSGDRLTEQLGKLNWCGGYLQAILEDLSETQIKLAIIAMSGVTFSGPDKMKQFALETLRVACVPEKVPYSQVARVLVKWLREHPERLHEPKSILTKDALREAFPCTTSEPAIETPYPTPAKP